MSSDHLTTLYDRRGMLSLLVGMAGLGWAGMGAAQVCVDPARLSSGMQSMRKALNYKNSAPDAKKHCSICAFFTAATPTCGKCAMLSGGPVSAEAVCDSWTAKA